MGAIRFVCIHSVLAFIVSISGVSTMEGNSSIVSPVPIPAQFPGMVLGGGSRDARVVVEAGLDLNCPDSAAAWPILQQLSTAYPAGHVAVVIHQFPLSYHRYAVLTTQAFFLVQKTRPDKVVDFMTKIFTHVDDFSTTNTANQSEPQVLTRLSVYGEQSTGISRTVFIKETANYRQDVITTWKYGARRGMAGTPWYFINGIEVTAPGLVTLQDWKNTIDPLLKESNTHLVREKEQTRNVRDTKQNQQPSSPLSSHILDTSLGLPASGVTTVLSVSGADGTWTTLDTCKTNDDGRCAYTFEKQSGLYQLTFEVEPYFTGQGLKAFFPSVKVAFVMGDELDHYHVPLLLSPYSYTTYRGS